MSEKTKSSSKARECPICGKPTEERYTPFCSVRCKQVDLNRWLGEVYVVPGNDRPANSDDLPEEGENGQE